MVTKAKKSAARKKNVKVLRLKKETVRNLRSAEAKRVKGGMVPLEQRSGISIVKK